MNDEDLVTILESYKNAIQSLQEKFDTFTDEIGHVREDLEGKISALEHTVNDEILGPAKEALERATHDRELEDFKARYAEKVNPFLDKIKAVEGDDFDFNDTALSGWKEYAQANEGKEDALDEEGYINSLLDNLKEQLKTVREVLGDADEVQVTLDEGGVEVKADGKVVAEEEESTEKADFEDALDEPSGLSKEEMKKLEDEMKAEGII